MLEHAVREDLNVRAPRVMGVLNPLKVVIENYPEGQAEDVEVINNPEDSSAGTRKVPFGRELFIERDDFMENPPKKFFRLSPGKEVRLRCAYFIKCTGVVKDPETGEVAELRCSYDPATRGGDSPDGRKVKATLHWVAASHALNAEVRLYDRLFTVEDPAAAENFLEHLNPLSLRVVLDRAAEDELRVRAHHAERDDDVPWLERSGGRLGEHRRVQHEVLEAHDRGAALAEQAGDVRSGEPAAEDESSAACVPVGQVTRHRLRCRHQDTWALPACPSETTGRKV